ncbi:MAG: CopG family transcriptional regulator [Candidatus Latescibacteria bacterium]|nr:CopG family transcriptional regulator [Candidatus Latescibacterota bacterium]
MKTLTVKIPEELEAKLERLVAQRGASKSALIRAALEELTTNAETVQPHSCLDLARDLLGQADGPTDLSYNKKHLKGYGR